MHGDRMYGDDLAIVGRSGAARRSPGDAHRPQKGRDTKERVRRNYGMPKPEGYRKALRLMRTAERFGLPIVTLIDTPGAYPGVGREERGQSEAIARNLFEMARLRVPDRQSAVIGEGGSGGALAIGVCDRLLMLQYSVYSVISPEGCASILWKSADKKELAAEAMGITADRLAKLGLVDEVLREPLGGAHRDPPTMAEDLKAALLRHLDAVAAQSDPGPARGAARASACAGCLPGCLTASKARASRGTQCNERYPSARSSSPRSSRPGSTSCSVACLGRPRVCASPDSGGLDSTVLLHALATATRTGDAAAPARGARRSRSACRSRRTGRVAARRSRRRWGSNAGSSVSTHARHGARARKRAARSARCGGNRRRAGRR